MDWVRVSIPCGLLWRDKGWNKIDMGETVRCITGD